MTRTANMLAGKGLVAAAFSFLVAASAHGEFYVWYDVNGVKQVSTHPPGCFDPHGSIDIYKPGCSPLTPGQHQVMEMAYQHAKQEQNDRLARCQTLKRRRDDLAAEIKSQGTSNIRNAMNMSPNALVAAPFDLVKKQREMLEVDTEYDECFPAEERAARRAVRDRIREKTAQGFKEAAQSMDQTSLRNSMRDLKEDVHDIKHDLEGP